MQPIIFQHADGINLNNLKCQIDRRIDLISNMLMSFNKNNSIVLSTSQKHKLKDNFCQTDYLKTDTVLQEITTNFINSPVNSNSMSCFKSPINIKKTSSNIKNKQNEQNVISSMENFDQIKLKTLNSIQENQKDLFKQFASKNNSMKNINEDFVNQKKRLSFKSGKRGCLDQHAKKSANNSNRNVMTQFKNLKKISNQSFNDPNYGHTNFSCSFLQGIYEKVKNKKSKSYLIESNKNRTQRKSINQSSCSNFNSYVNPVVVQENSNNRIIVSQQLKLKIMNEINIKLSHNTQKKQPKINNVRISLLKRLEDKHLLKNQKNK